MTVPHPLRTAFRHGDADAVTAMARAQVERSRSVGDRAGEVEGLYALARVALREQKLQRSADLARQALAVAEAAGDPRLEERPRHVLAGVARMSGDYARARDLYEASIELNLALGNDDHVHSEYHNLIMTELHLGNVERARELFTQSQVRVFGAGLSDFIPYLGMVGAALASGDGDMSLTARLIGFTEQAFASLGQVPDPDDARELEALRQRAASVLGNEQFLADRAIGSTWGPAEVFGRA